jgi:hypothetical protein
VLLTIKTFAIKTFAIKTFAIKTFARCINFWEQEAAEEAEGMIGNKPFAFSATSVPSCSKRIWLRPMTALGLFVAIELARGNQS